MEKITNPHDRLFRETWSDRDVAIDFLNHYLPESVSNTIDLTSLEICKDSFIENDLREFFSDLLYKVKTRGQSGYVHLLFEHKSHPDKLGPLQVLEYMTMIWRQDLKQRPKGQTISFPVIVPILICHGKTKWKHGRNFSVLFKNADTRLTDYIPDFTYILQDLAEYSDDEIRGSVITRVTMLLFKHIFDPDIIGKLPGILTLLKDLSESDSGLKYLEKLLRYLFSTVDLTSGELKTIVEQSLEEDKEELIMTLAEQLRNEGYQQGIRQGMQQGMLEAIELGLSLKFGNVDAEMMNKIRRIQDTEKLKAIKESLKTIRDLSDIKIP